MFCTSSHTAKTKALISCAVTAQLICVFVFAYAKSLFAHEAVHLDPPLLDITFALESGLVQGVKPHLTPM